MGLDDPTCASAGHKRRGAILCEGVSATPSPTTWALFAVVTAESYFSIPFLAVADLQNGLSKRKWDDAG
jgi:hypothetical protein